jgi:dTDP-4-amino-4,6-dideoxygalactose transaminase
MEVPLLKLPFDEEDARLVAAELSAMLTEGRLAMGPRTREFEAAFAAFCGATYAVGCSNGTAALEAIFRALEVEGGSVAVPGLTFMATALAPLAAGAKIILVDVDPEHFQMCPDDLAVKIRPDTKAVALVHLGGFVSPRWRDVRDLALACGAALVEDAAHAHGAEVDGRRAGSLGLAAAFSFYPTKVLTSAEGGMIVSDDELLRERLLAMRQHGQARPGSNVHESFGLNFRPSEIHALLGLRAMAKADWILAQRRRAAEVYDRLLAGSAVRPVWAPPGQKPAYYKYPALLPEGVDRARLKGRLKEERGVSLAGEVYAEPLNRQPFWRSHPRCLASPLTALPNAERIAQRQICLPIWPGLTEKAQIYVVESLLKFVKED